MAKAGEGGMMTMLHLEDEKRIGSAFSAGQQEFSPDDLEAVMSQADTVRRKTSCLGDAAEDFMLLWKLLQEYYAGTYREIPWKAIAAIGFAALYLINPFDVIPDVIPFVGYLDDAGVIGLVLKSFRTEIAQYRNRARVNNLPAE